MNPAIDILIQGSHGKDDPERASLPFIFGNAAATAGRDVTVLLTSDAVWLVTEGFASDIELVAQPTVGEMIAQLVDNGGAIWACAACTGPRGIEPNHLVDGVEIVSAAHVTAALVDGVHTIGF
jgi:predicted peroxiredoxin